jgi:hypothetical protein
VVTKKQRRSQLARAAVERRVARRSARELRNRRLRLLAATLTAIIAVAGLVAWIVTYDGDGTNDALAGLGYDAWPVSVASDTVPDIQRGIP